MSLAELVYKVGVGLATRLKLYGKRGPSYADEIVVSLRKVRPNLNSGSMVLDVGARKAEISTWPSLKSL